MKDEMAKFVSRIHPAMLGRLHCVEEDEGKERLEDADNAVLRALERELLDPTIIETAMQRAIETARPEERIESRRASTQKAIDVLTVELDRLSPEAAVQRRSSRPFAIARSVWTC